ncbi:MAG: leucyl aminopeptidase family protein [Methylobacteriaceae bacterium]|nr:leucyl aminopeptidase family protein [Methylobacteriaceae bacterium]
MSLPPLVSSRSSGIPVYLVSAAEWEERLSALPDFVAAAARAHSFRPKPGNHLLALNGKGTVGGVLFGVAAPDDPAYDPFIFGTLPTVLPAGTYKFADPPAKPDLAALSWLLGSYAFTRYKSKPAVEAVLVTPRGVNSEDMLRMAEAVAFGRDLVNTPTSDLGPDSLESAAVKFAKSRQAKFKVVTGSRLIDKGFPLIHAVGRAGDEEPRLITLTWGDKEHPLVTLVGKGVVFDTGGLDIKTSNSMQLMKKDMGGAAAALAAADMIMSAELPVRLKVVIPVVENSVSGNSFRPGDVIKSRKGLTVEIGNTDAEGRLILADALAFADEEQPDLLIDFATLTGAARVALGPDLPPFYTRDAALADQIQKIGMEIHDPVWRMPLWAPYNSYIDGEIADVNNSSNAPYAGSVTAALFLQRFVEPSTRWVHFDIFAWTPYSRPGRPKGGEVQAARLVYTLLKRRYRARPQTPATEEEPAPTE